MDIEMYNPANAANLTPEEIAAMQNFTDAELKELATRYPNSGRTDAYLVLKDLQAKSQIYPVSTWVNLYNLRALNKKTNYVPYTFKSLFVKRSVSNVAVSNNVQDLTQQEIEGAAGIRRTPVPFKQFEMDFGESNVGNLTNEDFAAFAEVIPPVGNKQKIASNKQKITSNKPVTKKAIKKGRK